MKRSILTSFAILCSTLSHSTAQTLLESERDFSQTKAPEKLTWNNFAAVAKHASQDAEEKRYHSVKWENSLIDAQQKAYRADKPILMILFFGDHRHNC